MEEMQGGVSVTVSAATMSGNAVPTFFHRSSVHYYQCKQDFSPPDAFSPVPYFLLCRAIELEVKARLAGNPSTASVKRKFGHHLVKAYRSLDETDQILTKSEIALLNVADGIYNDDKGFEYSFGLDALTGYSRFPDLKALDALARKLVFQHDDVYFARLGL